jgi:hypothetical protein
MVIKSFNHLLTHGKLNNPNKRKLPSGLPFFSVREKKVGMTTGAEINPEDLFFLDPFMFHLGNIDLGKINHPPSFPS